MIRRPAVAGLFYPDDPSELARTVDDLLGQADGGPTPGLRALVAPHAGYAYSGPVAASAFARVPPLERVALLGPSHFVPLAGIALSGAEAWATPLGDVRVADDLRTMALDAGASLDDRPHARDHALEVELPFLQRICPEGLEILPVAVGRARAEEVATLIEALDVPVVVSTDLSHHHDDATARRLDRETADAVVRGNARAIREDGACGIFALRGLVEHARGTGLDVELLDLRTSADTAGEPESVVGYGAFAFGTGSLRDASRSRGSRRR